MNREQRQRTAYQEWLHGPGMGDGEPCPICGSVLETLPASGRVCIRHDHQRHYEASEDYHGQRTGPVDAFQDRLPPSEPLTRREV